MPDGTSNPTFKIGLNEACKPHQLPFRTILQEYGFRRETDLLEVVARTSNTTERVGNEVLSSKLEAALSRSEKAYADLDRAKRSQDEGGFPGVSGALEISNLERECHDADAPLKTLLHGLQGNALCLSGGGIRSASFCLGVLEGLARYSTGRLENTSANGKSLLQQLDYLSTVSGGGYIGSWLMAWIYRVAKGRQPEHGVHAQACREVTEALAG